jgi:hypothetical protein
MKQFVKTLPKTGNCFKYLRQKFPHLSEANLKEGVLVGPDTRTLMFNEDFLLTKTEIERLGEPSTVLYQVERLGEPSTVLLPSFWKTTRTLTTIILFKIS